MFVCFYFHSATCVIYTTLIADLFEKMVPLQVQQSVSVYNQRKADLVNRSIAQMREATNLANG